MQQTRLFQPAKVVVDTCATKFKLCGLLPRLLPKLPCVVAAVAGERAYNELAGHDTSTTDYGVAAAVGLVACKNWKSGDPVRIWDANDPFETRVANAVEHRLPHAIEGVNRTLRGGGRDLGEFDIYGYDFVVEVFKESGKKKTKQVKTLLDLANKEGRRLAVYAPDSGKFVTRGIEGEGVPVFRNIDDLVEWIAQ